MTSVRSVLVVGAGIAGLTLSALLARAGVAVEIVERTPRLTAPGSGITLHGASLRVLDRLGVLDELRARGCAFDGLTLRSADGRVLSRHPAPSMLGVHRPALARLLSATACEAGAKVRLGASVALMAQDRDGVDVVFSDGDGGRYDLLVGADGIRSGIRSQLGIAAAPAAVGMGVWRVHTHRPAAVRTAELCHDGPCCTAGTTPTGPDTAYAYLVEPARRRVFEIPQDKVVGMRALAAGYHGPWDEIRDAITDPGRIDYTWCEHLRIDGPWNRGRAVLIGDAAHVCPPTLPHGATMALEDAAVLADVLLSADRLDQDLFDAFTARRCPRVEAVVDGAVQLATWLLECDPYADVPGLTGRISALLATPA